MEQLLQASGVLVLLFEGVVATKNFADMLIELTPTVKSVPRRIVFLREDEVAMTGNDKVKAGLLRELVAARFARERKAE